MSRATAHLEVGI